MSTIDFSADSAQPQKAMDKIKQQIEKFHKETGIKLEIKDGKPYYGGSLYLQESAITSLPDNLVVGGWLDLQGTQITDTSNVNRNAPTLYEWHYGKYIKVDGIFSVVDSHHGNVYKVHQIGNKKQMYVVGDGNGKWAHGETIDEARKDLIYKISTRDKSAYKNLKLDSVLTFEQAIECYRVITGFCAAGTKDYVENRLPKPHKEKYSIREIIELTKDEYASSEFEKFFLIK